MQKTTKGWLINMNTNLNLIEKTAKALENNNIKCIIANKKSDIIPILNDMLNGNEKVAWGGSVTLNQAGVIDYLKTNEFDYIEVNHNKMSPTEVKACYLKAFSSDVYFLSANAITENGELYNVDGRSNRVAALCFGPDKVIVIAGKNKIVNDIAEAAKRVKTIAAPLNTKRLDCDTYCKNADKCVAVNKNDDTFAGCHSDARICCNYVVTGFQREYGRITVILVNDELGY